MAVLLEAVAHAAARRLSTWATEAAHVARCIFDEDSPYGRRVVAMVDPQRPQRASALLETRHRRTVEYSKGVGGVMLAMFHGAGPGL